MRKILCFVEWIFGILGGIMLACALVAFSVMMFDDAINDNESNMHYVRWISAFFMTGMLLIIFVPLCELAKDIKQL